MLFALACSTMSCVDRLFSPVSENVDTEVSLSHEMIQLGEQLDDPYSVSNMTKAFSAVAGSERVPLAATDLYVRFLPSGQEQYDLLAGMGLDMLDHPMDYRILRDGDYYHDPALADDAITWQYAVVPADFDFPSGMEYEILHECFIPEHSTATKSSGTDWDEVEREAYRISGNGDMLADTRAGDTSAGPSGRITIVDSARGGEPEGVRGVMVSCNTFVKFCRAYTDDDGYYSMTRTFSSSPRYRLVFKNKKGFEIGFNLVLVPASVSTMGQGPVGGLDLHVTGSSERKLYARAAVNNAAYDYYCSCSNSGAGIKTPPANLRIWLLWGTGSSSAPMLQQGSFVESSLIGDFLGEYCPLLEMFLPDITLGMKGDPGYSSIYTLTTHELAHASHFMQAGKGFWDPYIGFILRSFVTSGFVTYGVGTEAGHGYCEVGEMWAYYVQTMMYRERYADWSASFGDSFWFSPQILVSLDDRGLTRYKMFNAFTSDVTDIETLQSKMLSLYPEMKAAINQAFNRYI